MKKIKTCQKTSLLTPMSQKHTTPSALGGLRRIIHFLYKTKVYKKKGDK